jgi:hypothetical protein
MKDRGELKLTAGMKKFIVITILVSFFSCKKDNGDGTIQSNEPKIESLVIEHSFGIDILGNERILTSLTFQYFDGYANFGTLFSEKFPESNCTILLYKKIDGDFYLDNSYPNDYVIPEANVGKASYRKPAFHISFSKYQGQVTIDLEYYQILCAYYCPGDTVKYSLQIMDRDSLFSNIIEKESIILIDL